MDETEACAAMDLAIGRLFRLGARPAKPGDVAEYYRVRGVVLEAAEELGLERANNEPNYVRDRLRGAQGDA